MHKQGLLRSFPVYRSVYNKMQNNANIGIVQDLEKFDSKKTN